MGARASLHSASLPAVTPGSVKGESRLGERLIAAGVLDEEGLQQALAEQRRSGAWFGDVLLDLGLCGEEQLLRVLGGMNGLRHVGSERLAGLRITDRTLALVTAETAERLQVVPLAFEESSRTLHVLVALPLTEEAADEIVRQSGAEELAVHIGTHRAVEAMIRRHFRGDAYAFSYLPRPPPSADEDVQFDLDLSGDIHELRAELQRLRAAESLRLRLAGVHDPAELPGRVATGIMDLLGGAAAVTVLVEGVGNATRGTQAVGPTAADASPLASGTGRLTPGGAVMGAPLTWAGHRLGAIHVAARERFGQNDLEMLRSLAVASAEVIEQCRGLDRLLREESSRTHLARFLSPALVDRALRGSIDVSADGTRRTATVLVMTLAGVAPPGESADPHRAIERLNELFESVAAAVHEEGGTLDRLGSRGASAVFGVPVGHGDDAARAVRAAARIAAIPVEPPLRIGVGVARGEVVFGSLGPVRRRDLSAFGPAVDLASRLSTSAGPGEVLLTRATVQGIEGARFEPRPLPQRPEELPLAVVRWVSG